MNNKSFKKTKLVTSLSIILGTMPMAAIHAEEASAEKEIEVIQVTGIRGSTQASINAKRFASSQVDTISAEDIGKLPDVTITDSLQRITGVQIERVAGEGGPVQIRGLPQIGTTMNGETFLSATTIDTSGADFGDLPAQLFSGVEVYKSAQSKNTASGIAGAIDLKTRRPFDLEKGFTFAGGAELIRGSISDTNDTNINGLFNYNADNFGFLVAAVTTDVTLATDYNGHNDTSENGGIGWTSNSHAWGAGTPGADHYIVPHGFTAFNKQEERERDALQLSFQADLGDGFEIVADYFYTSQDRFNNRRGFNHNSRWQGYADYAIPTSYTGDSYVDADGVTWNGVDAYEIAPYRLQTFTQVNVNEEISHNFNLELNYDNGGALTGQVRATRSKATAKMRHAYGEGDILSIDSGSIVTGPGNLTPAQYCNNGEEIIGDLGGCMGTFSQGIQDSDFLLTYDASGTHPAFGGFDQMVDGGKGVRSVADYMADLDSYHIGAFSSEGNTDDEGTINTFSTKWNYALEDHAFITSIDFGIRFMEREVDHDQFTYTSEFGDGCDIAQWKAVDQNYTESTCQDTAGAGEMVNGTWTPYTLLNPTRLDQHTSVSWQTDFGGVTGIPGLWSIDPENFRDPRQWHLDTFGNVQRTENGGRTYDVALDETSAFAQINFEYENLSGNVGMKVIKSDLYVKQNLVGPNLPHSGLGPDIGDAVTDRSFTDYLPSLNVAYKASEEIVLRGAYSKNMQALNLAQWGDGKSVGLIFDNDCNCMRVVNGTLNGNPELNPWRSTNYSLSAEYYAGEASMAYVATYKIDIESFTQSDTIMVDEPDSDGVSRGPWPFTANVQGAGGNVTGYEIGGKLALSDVVDSDSIFANFGIDANYTYSDSSQESKDIYGKDLPFEGMSKDTYNFVLWYEQEEFSTRLAWNSRSPRLITNGTADTGGQSLYQDDYSQLDISATYNVNENVSVYINGSNILEEFQQTYIEFSDQKAFQNIYEARWTLGARVSF
ncbi:TonB-dependent receptor [Thalassotalea profundi]|uniref:TonB-dependent receptor n=1 Tax=Thalassotalea profundi TaxID=2036687 RepID=A0ABQ3IG65_9GAMM|nr:TonB-dependent receptor [Thalassotalea profundi]GHE83433.1 TonB-dependent receptor [Thalassotalea profundi]